MIDCDGLYYILDGERKLTFYGIPSLKYINTYVKEHAKKFKNLAVVAEG